MSYADGYDGYGEDDGYDGYWGYSTDEPDTDDPGQGDVDRVVEYELEDGQ